MTYEGAWWNCSQCKMLMPPKAKSCFRCHTDRKDAPSKPAPDEPIKPKKPCNWQAYLKPITTVCSVLPIVSIFVPQLRPFVLVFKIIKEALKALEGNGFMTDTDVKDFTELEVALIALVKIVMAKKDLNSIIKECASNLAFQAKCKAAIEGIQDIPAELKSINAGKIIDIIKAAVSEVAS